MENEKKNDERNDLALPLCLNQFASVGERPVSMLLLLLCNFAGAISYRCDGRVKEEMVRSGNVAKLNIFPSYYLKNALRIGR